jgi:hypothetical protein
MSAAVRLMLGYLLCLLMVVPTTLTAAGVPTPAPVPAPAQPPAEPPPPDLAQALSWVQMGLPDQLTVASSVKPQTVGIPFPPGAKPVLLTGQLDAVSNAVNCRIEVFDGNHKYLGPIGLTENQTAGTFSLDLTNAAATRDVVELNFYLRQDGPPADVCTQADKPSAMVISQMFTTFSGTAEPPKTVADFMPKFLSQIVIRIGDKPSADVQQAALTLVSYLTHLYRPIPTRIDVDTSNATGPPPPVPLGASRVIVIREDRNASIDVINPGTPEAAMVISGQGNALRNQVELFSDRRFEVAQTASSDILNAAQFAVRSGTVKTFGELKMTGDATVVGSYTVYLGFDASEFGVGSIQSADIDLTAKYSPVGEGSGSVLLRAGPSVIATQALDQSGSLRLQARIPADAIQSNVGLALEIRYVPQRGDLPGSSGMQFSVQPESTVQVTPGSQTRRGFSVLPMAFVPEFNVAVDDPNRIRYAAAVVNLMGQQTSVALRPRLVTLDAGVNAAIGLLIVTSAEDLAKRGLRLPLLGATDDTAQIHGNPLTEIDLEGPLGIVETATSEKRTVLAISAVKDWTLVDRSIDFIRGANGQWGSLTGDIVATGAQGKSVNLIIDQGGGWQDQTPGKGWTRWALLSVGIAGLLVLAGGAYWLVRWWQNRPRDPDEPIEADNPYGPDPYDPDEPYGSDELYGAANPQDPGKPSP